MSKFDTALSGVFEVSTTHKAEIIEFDENKINDDTESNDDADAVRNNLYTLLEKGEIALEDLSEIAKAEESPRAFEVLNSLLNTMSDISMKIIEVEERKMKIKKMKMDFSSSKQTIDSPTTVNNNVVFVGTTQELQDQIKKRLSGN